MAVDWVSPVTRLLWYTWSGLQKEEDNVPVPESEAENQAGDIIDDFVEPIDDDPQLSLF